MSRNRARARSFTLSRGPAAASSSPEHVPGRSTVPGFARVSRSVTRPPSWRTGPPLGVAADPWIDGELLAFERAPRRDPGPAHLEHDLILGVTRADDPDDVLSVAAHQPHQLVVGLGSSRWVARAPIRDRIRSRAHA